MSTIRKILPHDADFHLINQFAKGNYASADIPFKLSDNIQLEFLAACYVLEQDGAIQATAALYNNPHLLFQGKKTFTVGNYECINNDHVATALLLHIAAEAKNAGAEILIGPMNGSTWDNYRFSTHHDYPHFFLEPVHHLYYNQQFIQAGFEVIAEYFSSVSDIIYGQQALIEQEQAFIKKGVTFRSINLHQFESELDKLFDFNALAFSRNFLYSPISKAAFKQKYLSSKSIINPEFVLLAEDKDHLLIGFIFCVKDFFNNKEQSLIAKTIVRHPDEQWRGMGHVLGNLVTTKANAQQYTSIIHAFVYDKGTSLGLTAHFEGEVVKKYALYGKPL